MTDQRKTRRRRKHPIKYRRARPIPIPEASAQWAEMPVTELGDRIWGEDELDDRISEAQSSRRSANPRPKPSLPDAGERDGTTPEELVRVLEERIASDLHEHLEDLATERRVILGGIRASLDRLGASVTQRVDEVARRAPNGTADERLERLTRAVERLQGANGGAEATMELRDRVEELARAVEGLGRARTPPGLSPEVQALERRVQAVEEAPTELSAALDQRVRPLEDSVENAIDELRELKELVKGLQRPGSTSSASARSRGAAAPRTPPKKAAATRKALRRTRG